MHIESFYTEGNSRATVCGTGMYLSSIDNEESYGRILSQDEYIKALIDRDDIFLIKKEPRLFIIEVVALGIGFVFGIWLCTMPTVKIAPDFYQKLLEKRTAKLVSTQSLPATIEQKAEKLLTTEKQRESIKIVSKAFSSFKILPRKSTMSATETELKSTENTIEDSVLLSQGNTYKKQQNYDTAIEYFKRVLGNNPHNIIAITSLGDSYLFAGFPDSAAALYKAALALNPQNATIHNQLGTTHYNDAIAPLFTKETMAIKKSPAFIKAQYDSAIAEYTRAILLDSTCVEAMVNRGVIRDICHDNNGALQDYNLAIKIKPTYAEAYSKRAGIYKTLGRFKEAVEDYSTAILHDSGSYTYNPTLHFANAYFGRGNVYYQMKEYEKAIADYDSTLKLSPRHSLAILNKARALGDAKQYDSAIIMYTKAISLIAPMEYGDAQEHAYFGRGLIYNLTDQFDKAENDLNIAIKLKPDDRYAYFHRANTEKAQHKFDEAIADYTIALEYPKLSIKSCWRIADCYALKMDKVNAMKWLNKMIAYGFIDVIAWKQDNDLSILWDDKDFLNLIQQP